MGLFSETEGVTTRSLKQVLQVIDRNYAYYNCHPEMSSLGHQLEKIFAMKLFPFPSKSIEQNEKLVNE